MDEQSSLLALFTSSFLAATLLPGGSEAVLFGVLTAYPQLYWPALAVASVGPIAIILGVFDERGVAGGK